MKRFTYAVLFLAAAVPPAIAMAGTKTATIPVSVTIVNGSTVSATAYIAGGKLVTGIRTSESDAALPPNGMVPIVKVDFDVPRDWRLVERVSWDKPHHHLTIDF